MALPQLALTAIESQKWHRPRQPCLRQEGSPWLVWARCHASILPTAWWATRPPSRLTAVFGIPQTPEQLPQHAVQAAIAIRHQRAEDKAPDGTPPGPAVLMAVHVGQVLVDVQARAELSPALDLYRAMDMTFWLPQAEATLAQVP